MVLGKLPDYSVAQTLVKEKEKEVRGGGGGWVSLRLQCSSRVFKKGC